MRHGHHRRGAGGADRNDEPYWSTEGWKRGDLSASDSPLARISSFAAMDTLLLLLADRRRFPGLKSVVVTGHSAGGQFTHRYAASSPVPEALGGVAVRFVVANPSSYLWLGPERPSGDGFGLPDTAACPSWNDWPHGVANRNADWRLDTTCAANLQGRRRFDRGHVLMRFMDRFHVGHRHLGSVVPGVGHSRGSMCGCRETPDFTAWPSDYFSYMGGMRGPGLTCFAPERFRDPPHVLPQAGGPHTLTPRRLHRRHGASGPLTCALARPAHRILITLLRTEATPP